MKLIEAANEVVLCAITAMAPGGCLPGEHPAVQLLQAPCVTTEAVADPSIWKQAIWGHDALCWRFTPQGDVAIAAPDQPFRRLKLSGAQIQACSLVRCDPTMTVQTGAHRGKRTPP